MTRSDSIPKLLAWAAATLGAFLHLACAAVPPASPQSPSQVGVVEGAPADVTRALRQAPPLPGSDAGGWAGLATSPDEADPHAAHRHGGRHGH
jgi:hypothetical protein